MSTATAAPKKKVVVKKTAASVKAVAAPKRVKVAASTAAAKPVKTAAKKTAAKKAATTNWREYGEHGFIKGSELDEVACLLVAGGTSRRDIAADLRKKWAKKQTTTGHAKDPAAVIATVTHHLRKRGYKEESTYRIVPPVKPVRKPRVSK